MTTAGVLRRAAALLTGCKDTFALQSATSWLPKMSCGNNRTRQRIVAASLLLLILWSSVADAKSTKGAKKEAKERRSSTSNDPFVCDPDKLLVYRVTLSTHWSRTNFPKQYPEWRPPAQWSKMIGNLLTSNSFILSYVSFSLNHSCNRPQLSITSFRLCKIIYIDTISSFIIVHSMVLHHYSLHRFEIVWVVEN